MWSVSGAMSPSNGPKVRPVRNSGYLVLNLDWFLLYPFLYQIQLEESENERKKDAKVTMPWTIRRERVRDDWGDIENPTDEFQQRLWLGRE